MEQYEVMTQSIYKNIQELSELCVDYGITNAYALMSVVELYAEMLEKAKANGGKVLLEMKGGDE